MVSKVGGTGPLPSPDRAIEVARQLQQSIETFSKQCETINPGNPLEEFAANIVQLAKLGREAQAC
jgi:hypothetical protein